MEPSKKATYQSTVALIKLANEEGALKVKTQDNELHATLRVDNKSGGQLFSLLEQEGKVSVEEVKALLDCTEVKGGDIEVPSQITFCVEEVNDLSLEKSTTKKQKSSLNTRVVNTLLYKSSGNSFSNCHFTLIVPAKSKVAWTMEEV
ncbi:MAG: hypothetical protein ACX932_02670, partial [Gammaproteobacteria bacterium]